MENSHGKQFDSSSKSQDTELPFDSTISIPRYTPVATEKEAFKPILIHE